MSNTIKFLCFKSAINININPGTNDAEHFSGKRTGKKILEFILQTILCKLRFVVLSGQTEINLI